MKDTLPTQDTGLETEIEAALHTRYGFNIGFAVEANRDEVSKDILKILGLDTSSWGLVEEYIDKKVEACAEYKDQVEQRVKNTPKICD